MKKLYDINEEEEFGCASIFDENSSVSQPPKQVISGLGIDDSSIEEYNEESLDKYLKQINSGANMDLTENILKQEEEREKYHQEEERRIKEIQDKYNRQRYEKEQAEKAARLAKEAEEEALLEAQKNKSKFKKKNTKEKEIEKERKKQEILRLKEEKLLKRKENEEKKLLNKQNKEANELNEVKRLLAEKEAELEKKAKELAQKEASLKENNEIIKEKESVLENSPAMEEEFEVPDDLDQLDAYEEEFVINELPEEELIPDPIEIEEKESIKEEPQIVVNPTNQTTLKKNKFLSNIFNKKEKVNTFTSNVSINQERIEGEPDWKYIAIHDELTDMLNSRAYTEDLKKMPLTCAVVFFDVNNLKYVNDTFSHEDGNVLLKTIANCIQNEFGKENSYRIGGDEFVVLLEKTNKNTSDFIQNKSSNIHNYLNQVMKQTKNKIPYAVSIGYAIGDNQHSIEDIIRAADAFMYRNKKAYKDSHPEYNIRQNKKQVINMEEEKPKEHDELLSSEQKSLKNKIQENHKIVNENSTEKIVREIQKRSNEINAILIASPNFDHLFIIRDVEEFIQIVLEQESLIDYSYLYVVYDGGPQYYGSDEYYTEVTHIFEAIAEGLMSGRFRSEKDIKAIKGINIFKNVFI